jgi:hypothetical protein
VSFFAHQTASALAAQSPPAADQWRPVRGGRPLGGTLIELFEFRRFAPRSINRTQVCSGTRRFFQKFLGINDPFLAPPNWQAGDEDFSVAGSLFYYHRKTK